MFLDDSVTFVFSVLTLPPESKAGKRNDVIYNFSYLGFGKEKKNHVAAGFYIFSYSFNLFLRDTHLFLKKRDNFIECYSLINFVNYHRMLKKIVRGKRSPKMYSWFWGNPRSLQILGLDI